VSTGLVILAAGAGRRMGGVAKCLLEFEGRSLLAHLLQQLEALHEIPLAQQVIVLGHHAEAIRAHLAQRPADRAPRWVINPQPEDDTASSLRVGLGALPPGLRQVAVLLADQPLINADDVRAALRAYDQRAPGIQVQVPQVQGQPGHPVILDGALCAQLIVSGAPTLRQWRAKHPQAVRLWDVDNAHYIVDVDTPQDLAALTRGGQPLRH
jgi:molybdenum cofactor cytidylyltransferase